MAHPVIEADECIACGVCVDDCPQGVLELQDVATVTDEDSCIACGVCVRAAPPAPSPRSPRTSFYRLIGILELFAHEDGPFGARFLFGRGASAQLFTLAAIETRLVVHELG